ncbi:tetratricopeptide repeat-containing sensor histidine kinase [Fulvivirga lutea]|uniref:histidine kinase n=1 Tax=Fulvivirga lutea TaxID=2810512 RepID=A0A974WHR8_9BACT|nr:tetratricopeptide repeat protein [Fulvivirga lutea]QSE98789.1 tetratricopeptide repeat protein [Fulvivirga lutea]
MKKTFLLLTCLLYLTKSGAAQNLAMIDSLKSVLLGLSGEEKVKVLRDLCYYSGFKTDFEEAVSYGLEAIAYASEIGDKNGMGASYQDLGTVYKHSGRLEMALDLYEKARLIFKETANYESEAFVMHNIGVTYSIKEDYPTAMGYLFKALDMKDSLGGVAISSTLNSIGEVYRKRRDDDKALEYYFRALEEGNKTQNKDHISQALNNIEIIYRQKGDYEKAQEYRMQVIRIKTELGDDYGLAISYNNLGELYAVQGQLKKAVEYFQKSLEIKVRLDNQEGIAFTSRQLASVYSRLNDFKNADKFAKKSLAFYNEVGNVNMESKTYKTLSEIYKSFGRFEQALQYYERYSSLKDSVFNKAKEVIMSDMATKYETAKKEAENNLLKMETEQQLATIAQKNQQVTLTIIGLLILLALAGLLFRAYRQKNRSNEVLKAQKEELARLNATKDRFFGIIAHDLRGPLTALQGISGLLNYNIKKGNIDNLNKIALQIEDSAQKVNTLLDNLLKWALSQGGAMPHRPQRLALKPIIEENLHYFKDMAAAKDIHLHADIAQDVHIHADKETLSTIFRNLINNSIKFTPRGGAVNLAVTDKEDQVQIDVQDNGAGIEEERLKNLFVLDDNKSTSGTANEKGTGLGLVLVDDFVRLNQGTIRVASKPGDGSVFSITLPTKYAKAG